jgi:hypothetical protein
MSVSSILATVCSRIVRSREFVAGAGADEVERWKVVRP